MCSASRAFVAAGSVRDRGTIAGCGAHGARFRCHQDLRAHWLGRGHFGPARHGPRGGCGLDRARCRTPVRRPYHMDWLFGAARCCGPTCMNSSSCWRRICRASSCARPRSWRLRKRSIGFCRISRFPFETTHEKANSSLGGRDLHCSRPGSAPRLCCRRPRSIS
jgi:hypothetical protein